MTRARRTGTPTSGVYLDHAFDIGAFNPCFPEYRLDDVSTPTPPPAG